jgi:hypothetical protein
MGPVALSLSFTIAGSPISPVMQIVCDIFQPHLDFLYNQYPILSSILKYRCLVATVCDLVPPSTLSLLLTVHSCSLILAPNMPQKPSMRTWGTRFDTLPTSPPVSPVVGEAADTLEKAPFSTLDNSSDKFSQKKEDKMPHDASVFVGR